MEKVQVLKLEMKQESARVAPIERALETIAGTDGTECLSDVAKNLGWNPGKFTLQLELLGWVFRRNEANGKGKVKAMQKHIDAGHLTHKLVNAGVISATGQPRYEEQVPLLGGHR
jgi:hypothetical protein